MNPVPPPPNGRRSGGSWEQFEQYKILELIRSLPEPRPYNHEELLANRRQAAELRTRISQYQLSLQRPIQHGNQHSHITALGGAICRLKVLLWRMFPFNDLPVEIVVNIFRYAAWSTINSPEGVLLRFHLTWVCRRWRHIAIQDQTLWNTIWFKDVKLGYQRSKLYFERAGTAALDLRIEDDDKTRLVPGRSMSGDDMNQILDILMIKSNQIRMLIVVVELWPPILVLLDRLHRFSRSLQQLERIEIHRTGRPYRWDGPGYRLYDYQHALSLFSGQAQRIKHICLNGIHLDWDRARLTNLTTLDLRRMPPDLGPNLELFRYMLESSPNLKKLCLDGAGPTGPANLAARSYPPVFLPQLENFILGDFLVSYAIFYAGIIHAPNVRAITILNLVGEDHTQLFKVLTGKFPKLLMLSLFALKIRRVDENAEVLVRWFLSIPKVKFVRIALMEADLLDLFCVDARHYIKTDARFMPPTEVTQANGSPIKLCPELEAIEAQEINMNFVVNFVSWRKKLEVPLHKLYIHHNSFEKMSPEERETLKKQNYGNDFVSVAMPMCFTPMEDSIWEQVRGG